MAAVGGSDGSYLPRVVRVVALMMVMVAVRVEDGRDNDGSRGGENGGEENDSAGSGSEDVSGRGSELALP